MVFRHKVWRRIWRSKLALAGGVMCVVIVTTGILAPVLARYDPLVQDSAHLLSPPAVYIPLARMNTGGTF